MRCTTIALSAIALLSASAHAAEIVTPENYVKADVDLTFSQIVREVGSNAFRHDRTLIPLDKQPAVTMNRDTIYSFGIFYAPKGTTITLPKSKDDRYQSAMILQTDHYIDQVFYGPGDRYPHPSGCNRSGRREILQDAIVVTLPKGVTAKEYVPVDWDMKSLEAVRSTYQEEAKALPNLNGTSGAHGTIDPHSSASACRWRSGCCRRSTPCISTATTA